MFKNYRELLLKTAPFRSRERGRILFFLFYGVPIGLGGLFGLVFTVDVVYVILYLVGKILLLDPVVGEVVGIKVMLTLYRGALAVKMYVLKVSREARAAVIL